MVAARRAMARMIDTLDDADRFAVFAFDDRIETPQLGQREAVASFPATDRNRFKAVEFLAKLESRGGTEIAQPLDQAVELLDEPGHDRDRILVLVTDGQVGNEDQVLKALGAAAEGNPRLHAGDRPGGQRRVPAPAGRAGAGGWLVRAGRVGGSARRGDGRRSTAGSARRS